MPSFQPYDIWSMGCIIFEAVVWLLYGLDGLESFYRSSQSYEAQQTLYYSIESTSKTHQVNPIFSNLLDEILANDPECNTASDTVLGDLLKLIRDGLLVPITHRASENAENGRISSWTFWEDLLVMMNRASKNSEYLVHWNRSSQR